MKSYQKDFIRLAIEHKVLAFGDYTLKSGRKSPYFFNAGKFYTGAALADLGRFYAQAIVDSGIQFDVILGPAYKGISLAALTAASLYTDHGVNIPFAYNRKEAKNHGEGGVLVGAPLEGKVLIIDDVITAGTAIREVVSLVDAENAKVAGVVIGLDRQEKGVGDVSAIEQVKLDYNIDVVSIAKLQHVVDYLSADNQHDTVKKIDEYRRKFGT